MADPIANLTDVEWVRAHLDDPRVRIVDATVHLTFDADGAHVESGRESYLREHLPGAVFADQIEALADPDGEAPFAAAPSERFAEAIGALGVGDDTTVVVYDSVNGIWATRLWWQFGLEGHDDVLVLDGGLDAWNAAGAPVESGEVAAEPARFTAQRRDERIASTDDVVAAVGGATAPDGRPRLLINALDEESFRSGRIPGSVNVPFGALVDEAGRLRPVDELRALLDEAGALDPDVAPVAYCGGGIAATAVTFALQAAGRHDVAVYDGSMTAWRSDPARPLDVG